MRFEIALRQPHPAQQQVINESSRFNVLALGRRWGKTDMGVTLALRTALRRQPAGWFGPSYKYLSEAWRMLRTLAKPVTARASDTEHRLELIGGGLVEAWTLDSEDPARGRKYARVVIDEAAMVDGLEQRWEASIRPTLMDLHGDAWFLSTPAGHNAFWRMWKRGQDPEQSDWMSWQMPTSANPFIAAEEIKAAECGMLARRYQQEILAQFLDDAAGVFRRVMEATTAAAQPEPLVGHQFVIGVDWGKIDDYTVFSVIDVTDKRQAWIDRSNAVDYQLQLARLKALCERYEPMALIVERNSMGEPLIEQLQRDDFPVQPFTTTNATKAAIIDGLALAFERNELAILPDPIQLGELQAYQAERLPGGLWRYSAPSGEHDDTVMALALAWYGASDQGPGANILAWMKQQVAERDKRGVQ